MVQEYKIENFIFRVEKTGRDRNGNPIYTIHNAEILPFKTGKDFKETVKLLNKYGYRKVKNQNKLSIKSYNIRHDLTQLVKILKERI